MRKTPASHGSCGSLTSGAARSMKTRRSAPGGWPCPRPGKSSWAWFPRAIARNSAGPIAICSHTSRAVLRTVENCGQLDPAMDVLIDLHQKRRQMLGEPGCFASPRFTAFHREVARRLLLAGQLQFQLLGARRPDGGGGISIGRGTRYSGSGRHLRLSVRHRPAATGRRARAFDHRRHGEAGHRARRAGRRFPPRRRAVQGPLSRPGPTAAGAGRRSQPHVAATAEQALAGRPQRETLAEFIVATRRYTARTVKPSTEY